MGARLLLHKRCGPQTLFLAPLSGICLWSRHHLQGIRKQSRSPQDQASSDPWRLHGLKLSRRYTNAHPWLLFYRCYPRLSFKMSQSQITTKAIAFFCTHTHKYHTRKKLKNLKTENYFSRILSRNLHIFSRIFSLQNSTTFLLQKSSASSCFQGLQPLGLGFQPFNGDICLQSPKTRKRTRRGGTWNLPISENENVQETAGMKSGQI